MKHAIFFFVGAIGCAGATTIGVMNVGSLVIGIPPQPLGYSILMVQDMEGVDTGEVTTNKLNACTDGVRAGAGSWSYTPTFQTNFVFSSSDGNALAYWWNTNWVTSAGSQSLGITFRNGESTRLAYTFTTPQTTVSFGYYVSQNLTNWTPGGLLYYDEFMVAADGGNSSVAQFRADGPFYNAHCAKFTPQVGDPISVTVPGKYWITGRSSQSNFVMSVYNSVSWDLLGESVVAATNGNRTAVTWEHNTHGVVVPYPTNFMSGLVLKFDGTYPVLPSKFATTEE